MNSRRAKRVMFAALLVTAFSLGTVAVRVAKAHEAVILTALWKAPMDLADRDLFWGPWGATNAPDPDAVYTFIRPKKDGTNPGVVVRDPLGRQWHIKQASPRWAEGPAEVVVSRVLSAVGYHQPPVYYLPSFTMTDSSGTHNEPGGRFRLDHFSLRDQGTWSWRMNPFIGMRPYQGLLVILVILGSTDPKSSNNTLYEFTSNNQTDRWYVVRDLGAALGETTIYRPIRNDVARFEQQRFITGVVDGLVEFGYHGKEQSLIKGRITPDEVAWASHLLAALSERQWHDAFRAGGYEPDVAARFIRKIRMNIAEGQQLADRSWRANPPGRPKGALSTTARNGAVPGGWGNWDTYCAWSRVWVAKGC